MIVWILKLRQRDEYDYTITFSSKEEAEMYIKRVDRHYYIPVSAELKLLPFAKCTHEFAIVGLTTKCVKCGAYL